MDANLFDIAPSAPSASSAAARMRSRLAALAVFFWLDTLKGRIAAGAALAMLLGIATTALQMASVAERELLAMAAHHEQAEAARTRAALARRVAEMQRTLALVARQLDVPTLVAPAALEAFFERQQMMRTQFSSVFAALPDGRVLLLLDAAGARRPDLSLGDRPYFARTVAERRAVISDAFPSQLSAEPIVVFTQPVRDEHGMRAVIGGTQRLASRDLLEDLADTRDDGSGTLVVITDADGRILAHPQRSRLLQPLSAEPRLAGVFAHWQAAGRPASLQGAAASEDEVVATASESVTGWRVWRASPRSPILAPLHAARSPAAAIAAGVALLLAGAFVVFLVRQLAPLRQLKLHAAMLLEGKDSVDTWPDVGGEIGELSRTLRHVWAERAQAEAFNAQVLQKLGSVMAASPVGLAFTRYRHFELCSAEMCRMLGRTEDSLVGQPAELIFASHDDFAAFEPQVEATFAAGRPYSGEWELVRADGTVFWARLRARPVVAGDADAGMIWSMYDISEQVAARTQLEHAATHDALTGVLNRKGFEHLVATAFAAHATPSTLVMIDLDRFKPINDRAGHAAGDAMLKAVARAIGAQVRASDAVGRLGGDEFALLLRGCDEQRAVQVAEKVRVAVQQLVLPWQGHDLRVGASLGVAERRESHETIAQWLADADNACYDAKRAGRDAVIVSDQPASRLRLVAPDSRR